MLHGRRGRYAQCHSWCTVGVLINVVQLSFLTENLLRIVIQLGQQISSLVFRAHIIRVLKIVGKTRKLKLFAYYLSYVKVLGIE